MFESAGLTLNRRPRFTFGAANVCDCDKTSDETEASCRHWKNVWRGCGLVRVAAALARRVGGNQESPHQAGGGDDENAVARDAAVGSAVRREFHSRILLEVIGQVLLVRLQIHLAAVVEEDRANDVLAGEAGAAKLRPLRQQVVLQRPYLGIPDDVAHEQVSARDVPLQDRYRVLVAGHPEDHGEIKSSKRGGRLELTCTRAKGSSDLRRKRKIRSQASCRTPPAPGPACMR